jgi:hypothetical protein
VYPGQSEYTANQLSFAPGETRGQRHDDGVSVSNWYTGLTG